MLTLSQSPSTSSGFIESLHSHPTRFCFPSKAQSVDGLRLEDSPNPSYKPNVFALHLGCHALTTLELCESDARCVDAAALVFPSSAQFAAIFLRIAQLKPGQAVAPLDV